jgi:hypothetical protein
MQSVRAYIGRLYTVGITFRGAEGLHTARAYVSTSTSTHQLYPSPSSSHLPWWLPCETIKLESGSTTCFLSEGSRTQCSVTAHFWTFDLGGPIWSAGYGNVILVGHVLTHFLRVPRWKCVRAGCELLKGWLWIRKYLFFASFYILHSHPFPLYQWWSFLGITAWSGNVATLSPDD